MTDTRRDPSDGTTFDKQEHALLEQCVYLMTDVYEVFFNDKTFGVTSTVVLEKLDLKKS